jgi:hypothetical protein
MKPLPPQDVALTAEVVPASSGHAFYCSFVVPPPPRTVLNQAYDSAFSTAS